MKIVLLVLLLAGLATLEYFHYFSSHLQSLPAEVAAQPQGGQAPSAPRHETHSH